MLPSLQLGIFNAVNLVMKSSFKRRAEEIVKELKVPQLAPMLLSLAAAPEIYHPSRFWDYYFQVHLNHLNKLGPEHFKRSVNLNYFNWSIHRIPEQADVLRKALEPDELENVRSLMSGKLCSTERPETWSEDEWNCYREFLILWWQYVTNRDQLGIFASASEPLAGNPLSIQINGNWISQDICNSVIETNSIVSGTGNPDGFKVVELGAGYGRIASLWLSSFENVSFTIIDIPPALFLSQWYLKQVFPQLAVFEYREFASYDEVKNDFENSRIRFLLPQQIELLPDKTFDLFLNISSLHEMTMEQIDYWFACIDRLLDGHFYTKQWTLSHNKHDGIDISKEDYPVRNNWKLIFQNDCPVQQKFFEALYYVGKQ